MKWSVLALAVFITALFAPLRVNATAVTDIVQSVRPLQQVAVGPEPMLGNMCTVSSIGQRLWLTAAHCVRATSEKFYIMGELVTIYGYDEAADVAFLTTPTLSAPPLKLSATPPTLGDFVATASYPAGVPFSIYSTGHVANPLAGWPVGKPYLFVQLVGAQGSSGSPIVNADGEIVSIVQIAPQPGHVPLLGGATWVQLDKYRYLWGM